MNVSRLLESERAAVEAGLERLLPPGDAWHRRLNRAMRHAVRELTRALKEATRGVV